MKKYSLIITLTFITLSVVGQNSTKRWSWNNFVTLNNVQDEIGKEYWKFKESNLGYETGLSYYLNPSFNISGYLGFGALEYENTGKIDFVDFGGLAEYKFNNGYFLNEDFWLKPYLTAGIGSTKQEDNSSLDIPFGAGVKIKLLDNLDLNIKSVFNPLTQDDNIDYLQTKIGLNLALGKGKGMRDKDGDGVADDVDACPSEKGLKEYAGCPPPPDQDGDGIADAVDSCPQIAGIAAFKGCPDSDDDGIMDSLDECPNIKGLAAFKGCLAPDSDQDGVPDSEDSCPQIAGLKTLNGCPDQDGDGITDKADNCPTVAGTVQNNGCPELNEEEKEVLKEALEGVNFLSGKDVLTDVSKPKLDNVAEILKAHATYNLKVSGYTDSAGAESSNLALSKKRASAVKAYLVGDGIDESRIEADGFGEANPIADNSTREGRAKNRRVEFEVIFE